MQHDPDHRPDLALAHHLGFGSHAAVVAPGILTLLEPVRANDGLVIELGYDSGLLTRHLAEAVTESSRRTFRPPRAHSHASTCPTQKVHSLVAAGCDPSTATSAVIDWDDAADALPDPPPELVASRPPTGAVTARPDDTSTVRGNPTLIERS